MGVEKIMHEIIHILRLEDLWLVELLKIEKRLLDKNKELI
jgi:hypothetical protein